MGIAIRSAAADGVSARGLVLDERQRDVVEHDGGPLLVCGGPGTGKTTVLVERWVRLASDVTAPHRVLLLVPTRDRALELRDELPWRLQQRAIVEAPVHTWHAFAYHLVTRYYRRLGYGEPPVLLTNPEQWAVVRDLLADEDPSAWGGYGDHLTSRAFVDEIADLCLRAGHRTATVADLERLGAERPGHAAVIAFALRYREHLRAQSKLDHAGLVGAAATLLEEADDIREAVRERFPHVLVDDAQELAPAQLHLLRQLCCDHLIVAGDPDSAIEAFRGADPRWLERFADVAPDHDVVTLPTCHRHGEDIGRAAARLIAHSSPADHRPETFAGDDGEAVCRVHATLAAEIEAAAREVRAARLRHGIDHDRMAILVSSPAVYLAPLARTLDRLGVPHRAAADRPLQTAPAVRAVLDLCRIALEVGDDAAELLAPVLSSPLVGLEPYRVRELQREAFKRGVSLADAVAADGSAEADTYLELLDVVRASAAEDAYTTFAKLFEASRWCSSLAEHRRAGDDDAAEHLDALVALSKALAHFAERRPGGTMRTYLASSADAGFGDTWRPPARRRGVHVLSFHAAKGREWDVVCVLGVAEGHIPKAHRSQGLFDPWALETTTARDRALAQLAEERRTMYVACTRARRRLVVSSSPGASGQANPSRFIEEAFGEVPEPLLQPSDDDPLTVHEAVGAFRRTLASATASAAAKAAAACAIARVESAHPGDWWWRRDWTDHPEPLARDGKLTTSYSRIGTYDNCPLQYVLQSVLGLDPSSTYQMRFGSLVHRIIELVERGEMTTQDEANDYYKRAFATHKSDYPNVVFARTYYTAGARMLKLWWQSERVDGETVKVEYSFDDLDFDGHTVRGRIDRVARNGKGLRLIDYKTSRSMPHYDDVKESLQLAIYYHAAKTYDDLKRHGEPVSMQLVFPGIESFREPGTPAKRYQSPQEAEKALEKLKRILADAAGERFAPSPEADCMWCKMRPLCPRWPEGREVGP